LNAVFMAPVAEEVVGLWCMARAKPQANCVMTI
jgi:hypothetical protein